MGESIFILVFSHPRGPVALCGKRMRAPSFHARRRGTQDKRTSLHRHFSPFGIHFSNFATSALADALTGMPQKSKKSPRFFFVIFE